LFYEGGVLLRDFIRLRRGLVSDRAGQHSIRVNEQFRICFVWTDTGPTDVAITNHYP
jgi:plasmid maintenance system killer protein